MVAELAEELGMPMPKVGTMVETPAAFIMAPVLAKYCDFFSIGTNDLTQYIMAADRGNSNVAYLYNTYDPAVLHALEAIIKAGKEAGIPVGMCGEAAADPMLIPLLISYGLDEFSVAPTSPLEQGGGGRQRGGRGSARDGGGSQRVSRGEGEALG